MKREPLVSVLAHTKNSQRTIRRHLQSIKNQSYPRVEIIVVDNNSTDKTKKIAREYTEKVFNYGPERSAQRNFAAGKAKGDYYLVPDSDMILSKNVIDNCLALVRKNPQVKEIVIPEKTIGQGFWVKVKALERDCYLGEENIEAARFFERNVFWEFGGYDDTLTGPEDWDLPQRIAQKYPVGRIKSWIWHDEGQTKFLDYLKRKYYYGRTARQYLKKQGRGVVSSTTIYFLRPAFYKNFFKLIKKPILFSGLVILLLSEQVSGFLGFARSFFKNNNRTT